MVRQHIVRWWLVVGMALGAASARAEEPQEEASEWGRPLVSARRMPGLVMAQGAFPEHTTILTREAIQRTGASNLPELLRRQAGVTLVDQRGFGLGADAGINLRGVVNSARSNVLVLVDGIRQNRVTGDEVHWQGIPMSQIERIEILRGGGGTIYGEGALAGVINISTRSGGEKPVQAEQNVEVGSYGWQQYVTSVAGKQGPLEYATSYTRQLHGGYRDSTAMRNTVITANAGYAPTDRLRLRVNVMHSQDTSHFAGGLTPQQVEQDRRNPGTFNGFFEDETTQIGVEQEWRGPAGVSTLVSGFWRQRNADSVTTGRFFNDGGSRGFGMRLGHEAAGARVRHALIAGTEFGQDKATTGSRGSTSLSESNRANIGLYAEETLTFWERLILVGGYRYDHLRFEEDLTFPTFGGTIRFSGRSPKLGATFRVNDRVSVYANYARSFKAPNIDDLDAVLPPFNDSVAVQPQLADQFATGVRVRPARWLQMETTWFTTLIKREILFNPFTFANDNFNTRRSGLEVEFTGELFDSLRSLRASPERQSKDELLRPSLTPSTRLAVESREPRSGCRLARLLEGLQYYVNGSVTRARFTKGAFTGYVLPATPEYLLNAGLTYEVLKGLRAGCDWQLVSTQFRINDLFNQLPADNYGVLNLQLRYDQPHYSVYLKMNNITGEEYGTFQSSNGTIISTGENPAPPTNWVAGMTLRF